MGSQQPAGRTVIEALLQAERLMVHGMVDHAERIYSSALEQDPLNAIAVVGLARVALERGDDQLAYAHARRALEIDPHNAAALRLEARLAEVLTGERLGDREDATRPTSAPSDAERPSANQQASTESKPDARPSERHVFTRNPSMAEHREMEEHRRSTEDDRA